MFWRRRRRPSIKGQRGEVGEGRGVARWELSCTYIAKKVTFKYAEICTGDEEKRVMSRKERPA